MDKYAVKAKESRTRSKQELVELRHKQKRMRTSPERQCYNKFGNLKAGFETREEALDSPGGRAGLRAYKCPVHNLWHLTKVNSQIK